MKDENGTDPDALDMLNGEIPVRKDLRITVYFQPDGNPIVDSGKASPVQLMAAGALISELGQFQLHQFFNASSRQRQQQQQQQQILVARLGSTKPM